MTRPKTSRKLDASRGEEGNDRPARPHKRAKKEEVEPQNAKKWPVWFLIKENPDEFSIDDLKKDKTTCWDGVRNGQARNIMKSMKVGDKIFYYHTSTKEPGIVGIAEVVKEAYPDFTAWDPKSNNYNPYSSEDRPKWYMVDIKFDRMTRRLVGLHELRQYQDAELAGMQLLRRPTLSVQQLSQQQAEFILKLEGQEPAAGQKD